MFKGQRVPVTNELTPNTVLDQDGFHVSYTAGSSGYGCPTTALVLKNSVFMVLKGDHRKAFEAATSENGLQACFDCFLENLDQAHEISEHHLIVKGSNMFDTMRHATESLGSENIERLRDAAARLERDAPSEDDVEDAIPSP